MKILGIAAYYHDSSASLISDGEIIAAAQEERFTRKKHDAQFPSRSIEYCLKQAELGPEQIDAIVFYEKPFIKFERLIETYVEYAPKGFQSFRKSIPLWLGEKLFQKSKLAGELEALGFNKKQSSKILFSSHHLSHAASAFYPSPFHEALILVMDGVGEWDTTSVFLGCGQKLEKVEEIHFPHSLGLIYSAFTYYCGFKVNSGEYKLMGLAPYGQPRFVDRIKSNLIKISDDGSFCLNLQYFDYCVGMKMTNSRFDQLFGHSFRKPEEELKQIHMDLACSIQAVLEEVILKICQSMKSKYGSKNLCLAGGVALNCVANARILESQIFEGIWIQPASGDAGGSLGAALAVAHQHFDIPRVIQESDTMKNSYLGPEWPDTQIQAALVKFGANFEKLEQNDILKKTAIALANQKVIGWFQGRMEFGPRSLGNRSILADARSTEMQRTLNLKIKFRESFRPFAPVLLAKDVSEHFIFKGTSPYMLLTAKLRSDLRFEVPISEQNKFGIELLHIPRSHIAAVTHLDYSARLQTIDEKSNALLFSLLNLFKDETGLGVLANTSFNVRGEPIVCTPDDAYQCFMGTGMDILVIGSFYLVKTAQNSKSLNDYKDQFALD